MKIIKNNHTEIWFSPKRYLIESFTGKQYFVIVDENDDHYINELSAGGDDEAHILHRKNGPSFCSLDGKSNTHIEWNFKQCLHRINGPSYINLVTNFKMWKYYEESFTEEKYWNK